VAAVDRAAEATHQCGDFCADRELAARAGFHQAYALDAADPGGFGPFAAAHMQLRVVQSKRLDLDEHMSGLGLGLGNVLVDQAVESPEFLQNDRTHHSSPFDRRVQRARKSRIAAPISSACVSSAKCPVSKKRTAAPGMSRLNASAPAGRKNGSFL